MIKKDGGAYARGTVNYNTTPEFKKAMWLEIVEAAKIVVERGGGNIRFRPPLEESERLFREQMKQKRRERFQRT